MVFAARPDTSWPRPCTRIHREVAAASVPRRPFCVPSDRKHLPFPEPTRTLQGQAVLASLAGVPRAGRLSLPGCWRGAPISGRSARCGSLAGVQRLGWPLRREYWSRTSGGVGVPVVAGAVPDQIEALREAEMHIIVVRQERIRCAVQDLVA